MGYSGQLFRYAKGPISEDDFPRPGEDVTVGDWGCSLKSYLLQILLSGDTTFMHEIIMGYQGEMSLKGLNRNQFESAMMKILRYRL